MEDEYKRKALIPLLHSHLQSDRTAPEEDSMSIYRKIPRMDSYIIWASQVRYSVSILEWQYCWQPPGTHFNVKCTLAMYPFVCLHSGISCSLLLEVCVWALLTYTLDGRLITWCEPSCRNLLHTVLVWSSM